MTYTIKNLAKISRVTVRTLHYYDEIGLLTPERRSGNDYRQYSESDMARLQQILFFRELDFPLAEIKEVLSQKDLDISEILKSQKKLLELKKSRLDDLIGTINKTILNLDRKGTKMTDVDMFDGFGEAKIEEYKKEAKERWGGTDAYKQSENRTKGWSRADFARVAKEWEEIAQAYADNIDKPIESAEVQAVVARHRVHINQFYDCSLEIFAGLAEMYVDDDRFAANYRKYDEKLPEFVHDAILYYCEESK